MCWVWCMILSNTHPSNTHVINVKYIFAIHKQWIHNIRATIAQCTCNECVIHMQWMCNTHALNV